MFDFSAVLWLFLTVPGLVVSLLLVGLGVLIRHYIGKHYPNETALASVLISKYGDQAETRLAALMEGAKAKIGNAAQ